MAISKELQLIAKIADTGNIRTALDAGIVADKFTDHDARLMFEYIIRYWKSKKTVGNIPTRELLSENFPTVQLPPADRLTIEAAVEEFLSHDTKVRLDKLIDYMNDWRDEPQKALQYADNEVKEMLRDKRTSVDIVVSDTLEDAKQRYLNTKNKDVIKGIPYPWPILNSETQGMQDGEYIIIYARPKSLKTWLGLYICVYAYDAAQQRVLIYTREMSPEQMMDRCLCLILGAPYDAFKKGYLHKVPHPYGGTMEEAFYGLLETMKRDEDVIALETPHKKSIIITSDRQDSHGGGVNGLRRKVEDHKPDLIFVDAVYLMRNDRANTRSVKWSDQAAISQDLKDLAQDYKRPVLVTLQANRLSEDRKDRTAANMAFSDSYAQDCDLAMEVIKKRIDDQHNELGIALTASREANIAGFGIHGNPGNDFSMLTRPITDKYGLPIKENGEILTEPMIFGDFKEITEYFNGKEKDKEQYHKKEGHNMGPSMEQLAALHTVRR